MINVQVFKPEAQAKELADIALESSFACASGSFVPMICMRLPYLTVIVVTPDQLAGGGVAMYFSQRSM